MSDGGVLRRDLTEFESRETDTAITYGGFVLKLMSTGHVDLAGADEISYGIATKSTREFVPNVATGGAWTAASGVQVPIQRVGEALVQLLATNAVITLGEALQTAAGGTVDEMTYGTTTPTLLELQSLVGIALEGKGASAGGVIKVLLCILWL